MSQESTSGQTEQTPEANAPETTVPKSHADKLLGEKKKLQQDYSALKAKLDAIEQENLSKQGEFQKLADKYKAELETERTNALNLKKSIVQSNVKSALKEKAKESGLSMEFDDFAKLINIAEVNVDEESGEVVIGDVERVVTSVKTKYPELFKKQAVKPNTINQNQKTTDEKPKALHELSDEELKNLLAGVKN